VGWEPRENPIVARAFRLNSTRALWLGAALMLAAGSGAAAQQDSQPGINSTQSLKLPDNLFDELSNFEAPPAVLR